MPLLGLNIDHVATVRQARRTYEPDPVWAAVEGQLGGAAAITVHLREDRRHIQDADVQKVKEVCQVKLNMEMAATDAMVGFAAALKPHMATLVPEGRAEITTEGGLDVAADVGRFTQVVRQLNDAGIAASAFINAETRQVEAAAAAGFGWCEVHTGPYADLHHAVAGDPTNASLEEELQKVARAGAAIVAAGMCFNAGHGLNDRNVVPIARLPDLIELHIGHSIIAKAVFIGLRQAVARMVRLIEPRGL